MIDSTCLGAGIYHLPYSTYNVTTFIAIDDKLNVRLEGLVRSVVNRLVITKIARTQRPSDNFPCG